MPDLKFEIVFLGQIDEDVRFVKVHGDRLFHKSMDASLQEIFGDGAMGDRRRADVDGLDPVGQIAVICKKWNFVFVG